MANKLEEIDVRTGDYKASEALRSSYIFS